MPRAAPNLPSPARVQGRLGATCGLLVGHACLSPRLSGPRGLGLRTLRNNDAEARVRERSRPGADVKGARPGYDVKLARPGEGVTGDHALPGSFG